MRRDGESHLQVVPASTELARPDGRWARARRRLGHHIEAILQHAARRYVVGDRPEQALALARELRERQILSTLGYWNADGESPDLVAANYLSLLDSLAPAGLGAYVSVKAPALHYDRSLSDRIVSQAGHRRVHFDAHEPDTADLTFALIADLVRAHPGATLGMTLPARWRRSLQDAELALHWRTPVRIVRGQWQGDDHANWRAGFLSLVDQLAGRARAVSIASHNVPLAREALRRLRAAGTPCDLELLYGLPVKASLAMARSEDVPVRVYVPFGHAFLPYALHQLRRNPRIMFWLLRDLVTGRAFKVSDLG